MAYNNFYTSPYQAPQYPQYPQYQQQMQSGFISVRSAEEAFNWPIAPGNSIMFKDENSPYVYVKTKGFSQLDQPVFERYRLVKEDGTDKAENTPIEAGYCEEQIKLLWDEINTLKCQKNAPRTRRKKEVKEDAAE